MLAQKDREETFEFSKAVTIITVIETVKADLNEAENLEQAKRLINENLLVARLHLELCKNKTVSQEKLRKLIKETLT